MAINSIDRESADADLGYNCVGRTAPDGFAANQFGVPADIDDDLPTAFTTGSNIAASDFEVPEFYSFI